MHLKKFNFTLVVLPILIYILGFITLLSVSPDHAKDQTGFFIAGILVYILVSLFDYEIFKHYWKYFYIIILALLLTTFFSGLVRYGSARWLGFGSVQIQPSEFAKIIVVLGAASMLTSTKLHATSILNLAKMLILFLPVLILVLAQPDLGTALVAAFCLAAMLLYAGIDSMYFIAAFLIAGIFSTPAWNLLHEYQKRRILIFLNPELDVLGSGYNVIQSMIAVGSGGMFGRGFGQGTQSHLRFLPAYWTDFIFASFAEEWGFLGVLGLVSLFCLLLGILLYIAFKAKDSFGSVVCVGVFAVIFFQFTVNVGMNLGLMPVTGIPLPLFSYGGSSMLTSMFLLGLAQSVWLHRAK